MTDATDDHSGSYLHYSNYRYRHYDGEWQRFYDVMEIGKPAPDFTAETVDGDTVALADYRGRMVLLETGSMSCPMYVQALRDMSDIVRAHPDIVHLLLYTREAHPGGKLPPFQSFEQKRQRAKRLQREESEPRRILIDNMAGDIHRAFGGMPNSSTLIDASGNIAFFAQWNDPAAMARAIDRVKTGQATADIAAVYHRPKPPTAIRTFRRAGWISLVDFLIGLPRILYHHWKYD